MLLLLYWEEKLVKYMAAPPRRRYLKGLCKIYVVVVLKSGLMER